MKVVALGGCGGMGPYAVRAALTYEFVDEVVIADLDSERDRLPSAAACSALICGSASSGTSQTKVTPTAGVD